MNSLHPVLEYVYFGQGILEEEGNLSRLFVRGMGQSVYLNVSGLSAKLRCVCRE